MKKNNSKEINEHIERALLMMKYNSSKTLTENEESIKPIEEDGKVVTAGVAGAGIGAGVGAGIAAATVPTASTGLILAPTGAAAIIPAVASTLGVSTIAATAVVGGAIGVAVLPLAYWFIRKDTGSASSVKALLQMCTSNRQILKLQRKFSDSEIRDMADDIYDAVNHSTWGFMAGTDEEKLFGVFKRVSQGTAADVCALNSRYSMTRGDLYDDLDGDIDSPDEWEQIYRPLRNCVEDSLRDLPKENPCAEGELMDPKTKKCVKTGPVPVIPPKPKGGKCKPCSSFPMNKWCKSSKIAEIQRCLGIGDDGCYGPKTESKLKEKGYSTTITQEVYDKILKNCGKSDTDVSDGKDSLLPDNLISRDI